MTATTHRRPGQYATCIPYIVLRCPYCGRPRPRTTALNHYTTVTKRWHLCPGCGNRFTSMETAQGK